MSADLKGNPLVREFFIKEENARLNTRGQAFFFYDFEKHDNLQGKVQILENYGFVVDVTSGNTKRYRMQETFAEFLLSLEKQSASRPARPVAASIHNELTKTDPFVGQ
jgi:hypothetical protein